MAEETRVQLSVRIEADELHRIESPTEERLKKRAREIRDLRCCLKNDERFIQVTWAVRRLPDV
jgi:hypothetical protein